MKKILVVFTGGTIGSSIMAHTINTAPENAYRLLHLYRERFTKTDAIAFSSIAPIERLSENLVPADWPQLLEAIAAADTEDLDGIIVTHGTDTLAFSAAALGFYFAQSRIPLVMVSSDYPLTDARANGLLNFHAAVTFIVQRAEAGVFVAYTNQGQCPLIHRATRLASCLPLSNDFMSVQGKAYLAFDDGAFTCCETTQITPITPQPWSLKAQFSADIAVIRPYPGLNYALLDLTGIHAVVHDCYHSGTACTSVAWGEQYNVLGFIARCQQQGIGVYFSSALKTADQYVTTQAMLNTGAEIVWNMSLEAAYVKLMLAYGNFSDSDTRKLFLAANIAYEIL